MVGADKNVDVRHSIGTQSCGFDAIGKYISAKQIMILGLGHDQWTYCGNSGLDGLDMHTCIACLPGHM